MKTTHRIAATLLLTTALASCASETDDNDSPAENVTTDTNDEDDASED